MTLRAVVRGLVMSYPDGVLPRGAMAKLAREHNVSRCRVWQLVKAISNGQHSITRKPRFIGPKEARSLVVKCAIEDCQLTFKRRVSQIKRAKHNAFFCTRAHRLQWQVEQGLLTGRFKKKRQVVTRSWTDSWQF